MIGEFLAAWYGEGAAPFVRQYLDAITKKAVDTGHLYISNRPEANVYFGPTDIRRYDALWDKAEQAAAGNAFQLENVRRSRLSLRCYKANMLTCEFSPLNPGRLGESKRLFDDIVALGVTQLEEGRPISDAL
jgi:hypothetical protein